jgi:hypothetical protein
MSKGASERLHFVCRGGWKFALGGRWIFTVEIGVFGGG